MTIGMLDDPAVGETEYRNFKRKCQSFDCIYIYTGRQLSWNQFLSPAYNGLVFEKREYLAGATEYIV